MYFGLNPKGWTVIDGDTAPTVCGVSVRTSVAEKSLPQVLAALELPAATGEAAPEVLRELAGRLDRKLPPMVTLPRQDYRLRVMAEPAVPARELLSSLRWALSTEVDNTIDDFNLAWMRIPNPDPAPSRPLQGYTIQTSAPMLQQRMASWRAVGLRPKVVDIRETALRNIAAVLERGDEGLAFVAADAGGVGMVFTHHGSLYLDRYIEQPIAELRAADAVARERMHERIAVQLMRSIDVIGRTYPFMPVSRVIVAPPPEPLGLEVFLASQLPVAVEALDLARVFDLSGVPELAASPALQARCLVPLGAALRTAKGVGA